MHRYVILINSNVKGLKGTSRKKCKASIGKNCTQEVVETKAFNHVCACGSGGISSHLPMRIDSTNVNFISLVLEKFC